MSVSATELLEKKTLGPQYQEGLKILEELGLRPFSEQELKDMADKFKEDLLTGLKGEKSNLPMIRTYLETIEPGSLPKGKRVMILSIGGSSPRVAVGEVGEDGKLSIAKDDEGKELFFKEDLKKKQFESAEEFWDSVVDQFPKDALMKPDAIALIWGFPANTKITPYGIDAVSYEELPKGIVIPGISGKSKENTQEEPVQSGKEEKNDTDEQKPVGEQLAEAIERRLKKEKVLEEDDTQIHEIPIVVANDTAAVAIAVPGTKIAIINGTGYNMAIAAPKKEDDKKLEFYNMEAGGFDKVPQNEVDKKVDGASDKPGHYKSEKQVSGLYTGQQVNQAVEALNKKGLPIRVKEGKQITGWEMEALRLGDKRKLDEVIENLEGGPIDDDMVELLKRVTDIVVERSAGALGTYLGASISALPDEFPSDEAVKVAFDGSNIRRTPGYQELAGRYARHASMRNIQFVDATDRADLIGAGSAALSVKK